MKPLTAAALCVLSASLTFPSLARADDPATPPAPAQATPPAAQPSPAAEPDSPGSQQHPRHRMRPAFVLGELTEKLSLTPDQQKQVGAFIDDGAEKAKAVRADETLSKDDKHAKVMGITKATREQIRGVLTPVQQKQFDVLHPQGGKPKAPVTGSTPPATNATPPAADPKPPASN